MKLGLIRACIVPFSLFLLLLGLITNRRHIFPILSGFSGSPIDLFQVSLYLVDILFLVGLILAAIKNRKTFERLSSKMWLFGWFLLVFLISPRETIYSYYFFLVFIGLSLIILVLKDWFSHETGQRLILFFKFFTLFGVVESSIASFQFIYQRSLGLWFLGETHLGLIPGIAKINFRSSQLIRPYGTFAHPNLLSAFMLVACATALSLLIVSKDHKSRTWNAVALLINTFGLVLTFSRAGIVGWVVSLAIFFVALYIKNKKTERNVLNAFLISLFALLISLSLLSPYLKARAPANDNATSSRITYDEIGLDLIKEKPITGWGIGNTLPEVVKKSIFHEAWQIQPPHNFFILVACETGIVGLIIVLYFFGSLIYKKARTFKSETGDRAIFSAAIISIFIGFLFLMQFDHYFYDLRQTQVLLAIWVALMMI